VQKCLQFLGIFHNLAPHALQIMESGVLQYHNDDKEVEVLLIFCKREESLEDFLAKIETRMQIAKIATC